MPNIKYDFDKYKNALRDYLSQKGIDYSQGNIRCINPSHEDAGPSMAVYEDNCYCFACAKLFDIYDAVGFLEGITDRGEQFRWVDFHFGNGEGTISKYTPKESVAKERKNLIKPLVKRLKTTSKNYQVFRRLKKKLNAF